MDALRTADLMLAQLYSHHPEYAVPGHVGSPMDDRITVTLSRDLIRACDPGMVDDQLRQVARGLDRPAPQRRAG